MKVAISSNGPDKESSIDQRFGRCPYFIIVDMDEMNFETMENKHTSKSHGVGPQVVQTLSNMEIEAVITGNVGPNAYRALDSANIKIYKASGKVSQAIERLKNEELEELEGGTVQGHYGGGRRR